MSARVLVQLGELEGALVTLNELAGLRLPDLCMATKCRFGSWDILIDEEDGASRFLVLRFEIFLLKIQTLSEFQESPR